MRSSDHMQSYFEKLQIKNTISEKLEYHLDLF